MKSETVEYLPRFAACRDIGHEWDYFEWKGFKRTLHCYNCIAIRIDTMDARGRIVGRRYIYPSGYHYKRTPKVILELRLQLQKEARKLDRWVGERRLQ
jgi:hypothetical protein